MNVKKIDNCIYKTLGFFNFDKKTYEMFSNKDFLYKTFPNETQSFLNNSYHSEFIEIMFARIIDKSLDRYTKDVDYEIVITHLNKKIKINNIEIFLFIDPYKNNQTGIFSLSYDVEKVTFNEISDLTNSLRQHKLEIEYDGNRLMLREFISKYLLNGINFYDNDSPIEQFAGNNFKNYLIIDNDVSKDRDNLLFELGTFSKIGSSLTNSLESPSESYMNKVLDSKISCFKNYDCLALLNSFTVIGIDNYNKNHAHTHSSWNDIYFSIYVYSLYLKCSLQILSNDFSTNPKSKRFEFQNFYNKYYRKKISYNFLPNEIYKGINSSLEIDEDLDYVENKLESFAVQINEKQQRQQELLLLILSVIAALELPLYIDGIRKIIGIEDLYVYNLSTYIGLVLIIIIFIIFRTRKKY
tara:strand:+ start:185 stop:1417 length:1233 start_codon:yes stop_codon:yes gene_type:complete